MALEFEDFVTGLTEETTPDNAADFIVIVDTSGSDVNKVRPSSILGTDLSAIRALTPSNDDVLQRKAGAWTNRTMAQLKTDLAVTTLTEEATPSNPAANTVRLFARDNGSGKTELCVIFPSGAVQVLATEL